MEFVRVEPPGYELAMVRRGALKPGAAPATLVFVHGLGDSSSSFAPAFDVPALAPYNLVLVDLLGHGQSDKPDDFDYRPASHAAVLFQALRKAKVRPPVVLVGYSLGAAICVGLARFPVEGLRGAVLVEPALAASRMSFAARVAARSEPAFIEEFPALLSSFAAAESSEADRRWAETAAFASARAFFRCAKGALDAAFRGELERHARELTVPLSFVLTGATYEQWPLPKEFESRGARVYLVESPSKMPFYDNPDSFYSAVAQAAGALTARP